MRNILSSSRKHDYVRANEATSVFLEEVELVGGEPRSSHELFPSPYSSEFDDGALKPRPRRRPVNLCAWIALVLVALAFAGGLAAGLARRGEAAGGDALAISKNVSAAASSGAFGSATDETRQLCSWAGLVLPEGAIIPSAYNLTIHLRPDHFVANAQNAAGTFQGEVSIAALVNVSTSCVVLHSDGLQFSRIGASAAIGESGGHKSVCLCGSGDCKHNDCAAVVQPVSVPANQADPHLVIISFGNTSLAAGHNITLGLQYQASLGVMDGLYRSDPYAYDNPNGGEELSSVMLVTQFEEFGARKAFPCFDEPRYKAKFMLSLEVPKQYTALANMPQTSRTPSQAGSNLDMATFAASPIMSPYLVAIAVGELHGHWALTSDGKNVTVWSAPRKHHGLAYPLQIATRALDFFANWTGVAQPLLKFDLVAVPGKMGAMENWGLLLFDETRFLHDSAYSGSRGQWLSADVVCHELAHQWFGNLVTCADWTQLTVNEGVASFMEYKCLEAVAPEMSAPALFHLATTPEGEALGVHEGPHARALQADADALSQPLVIPQDAADAAFQDPAYGTIVYSKGAAVLRMLEGFWEAALPGSFQEGLQHYLVSHAYSMATTDDLLASLLHVASQGVNSASLSGPAQSSVGAAASMSLFSSGPDSVIEAFAPWFHSPGYPVVAITSNSSSQPGMTTLSQQRFLAWSADTNSGAPTSWFLPLSFGRFGATSGGVSASGNDSPDAWVEMRQSSLTLPDQAMQMGGGAWVLNKGSSGLFRTLYTADQLDALTQALQGLATSATDGQDPSDRGIQTLLDASTLVSDACALALAGQLSPEAALGIATAAAESPAADSGFGQYLLLLPVLEELQNLERLLQGNDSCIADLHKFTVRMLEGHVQRLVASLGTRIEAGPQDAFLNNLSKGNVVWAAAKAGDAAAAAALCQLFTNSSARNSLDPDWRGAAYLATVAQPHGCQQSADAKAAWSSLLAQWEGENDITTARSALYALPAAASLEALKATLDLALDLQSNHAKPASLQDAPTLVHNVAQSKAGQALAWQYLQDNWPAITAKFGTQGAYMLLAAIPFPPTQVQYDSLAAFLGGQSVDDSPAAQQALQHYKEQLLGRLRNDIAWLQNHGQSACGYLAHAAN